MALPGRGQGLGGPPGTKVPSWRPGWQGPAEGGQCLLPAREGGAQFPLQAAWGLAQNPGALGGGRRAPHLAPLLICWPPSLGEAHPFCSHPTASPRVRGPGLPGPPAGPSVSCSPWAPLTRGPSFLRQEKGWAPHNRPAPPYPCCAPGGGQLDSARNTTWPRFAARPDHLLLTPVPAAQPGHAPLCAPGPGQEVPPTSPPALQESRNTQG